MKGIALFGRWTAQVNPDILDHWRLFLREEGVLLWIEESFAQVWSQRQPAIGELPTFCRGQEIQGQVSLAFVIGGDGAFLDAARVVALLGVPLVGIHAGRLGFLTEIPQQALISATQALLTGQYRLEGRSLLAITTDPAVFQPQEAFALNEVTFSKAVTAEMILVDVYLNGELINTYWADGVIVATPTGSTAYSLACGGPILTPDCQNFVITPMAPHSLTVRPLVLPDDGVLTLSFQSRTGQVQIALDGRSVAVPQETLVALRRAAFDLKIAKLPTHSYFQTLRSRLSWGVDRRER
ncbi:MAG: NAD(+)/NADH kinase [Bacteroidia bacterium]|jgi:NAD+ kinase|nr:NAD(+)/NADH kinase [Bacteroidia bacterium]GIV23347.1 MAG: NAD kinase [Bacteroidia bacterium]